MACTHKHRCSEAQPPPPPPPAQQAAQQAAPAEHHHEMHAAAATPATPLIGCIPSSLHSRIADLVIQRMQAHTAPEVAADRLPTKANKAKAQQTSEEL